MARIRRIDAFLAFVAFVESISVRFATHYIRANGFSNPRGLREKKNFDSFCRYIFSNAGRNWRLLMGSNMNQSRAITEYGYNLFGRPGLGKL